MLQAYGIRAISHDVLLPRMRARRVTVPGRDGSYDFGAGAYEDRLVRISCDSRSALARGQLRELALLLSQRGRLTLWDEPDKHYVARLYDEAELRYIGRIGHTFDLTFVCEPFAVGTERVKALPGRIGYPGTARTPCAISIRNDGGSSVIGLQVIVRRAI